MPSRKRILAIMFIAAIGVAAGIWYHNTHAGTFWDDATDGQCVAARTLAPVQRLMGEQGFPRTPTVPCEDRAANYVIVAHTTGTAIRCPDGDKDTTISGRVRMVGLQGRMWRTSYGYGLMCAAPVLPVGACYTPGTDRGPGVRPVGCNPLTWRVTRRIDGVADIHRCDPATGLVLTDPRVTYCESVFDDPTNPLSGRLHTPPPPAG